MTRKRRSFSPEFKQEAASLVLDQGYTIPQASVSLGIGESAIRRWVNQLTEGATGKDLIRSTVAFLPLQRRKTLKYCPGLVDHYSWVKAWCGSGSGA